MLLRPPTSTLFPYTTLFRSVLSVDLHVYTIVRRGAKNDLARPENGHAAHAVQPIGRDPCQVFQIARCAAAGDRKSTRLNSSHRCISYAVFCLQKKKKIDSAI